MKESDWQNLFGKAPASFLNQVDGALKRLEEDNMKRRYKLSAVLIAAALTVVLVAGAAIAATNLRLFELLDTAEPIVPLEGAEEMIVTDLGTVENELVRLDVEEAVYDGRGAMVKMRLIPKDPEHYALLHEMLQDTPEAVYDIRREEHEDGSGSMWILGRKDGKTILNYAPSIQVTGLDPENAEAEGQELFFDSWNAEEEPDGSVIIWGSGFAEGPMPEQLKLTFSCNLSIRGQVDASGRAEREELPMDELTVTIDQCAQEQRAQLVPVGNGSGERFQMLSGSAAYTKVQGYLSMTYTYEQAEGEEMGITLKLYDAEGKAIHLGSGSTYLETGDQGDTYYREVREMQSFDELPETLWVEAKVIGEDKTLGRVECKVVAGE